MKTKITHKKKQTKVNFEDKFLDEQKYSEQGFHLVDPKNTIPEYIDEMGITDEEENEPENNEELKKGKPADKKSKKS